MLDGGQLASAKNPELMLPLPFSIRRHLSVRTDAGKAMIRNTLFYAKKKNRKEYSFLNQFENVGLHKATDSADSHSQCVTRRLRVAATASHETARVKLYGKNFSDWVW